MTTVFRDIGAYRIVREIGHGGMATVFLAEDTRHDRQVALKLVSMAADREGREILDAERWGTRLQARLAEECGLVPRVYEDGDQPPYYFIAMEYVEGENLSDVLTRGRIGTSDAVCIASELARFLDTAHQFKTTIDGRSFWSLVHGDLKPRNVRVAPNGDVKVLDFGIAKALSLSRKVTRNDFGSIPYLSPERLESTQVDAQADLWALGVIFYELLSGAPPFQAVDTRRLEHQIRAGYACRPLPISCPRPLQAVVARLLAQQLADRYESAGALRRDLDLVRDGKTPTAEALGFPGRADEAATRRTRPAADADPERTRRTILPAPPVAVPNGGTAPVTSRWDRRPTDVPRLPMPAPVSTSRTAAPSTSSATPASTATSTGTATSSTSGAPAAAPSPGPAPVATSDPVPVPAPPAPAAKPPRRHRPASLRTILVVAALLLVCNEIGVGFKARRLEAAAATSDLDSIQDVWSAYDTLSRHSYLRMGITPLEKVLAIRAGALADQVIANYRSPLPSVRERQWEAARESLKRALVLTPSDRTLKASLRYCEGHLHRIDGEAETARHHTAAAREQFTEAVSAFREAAELRRDWPDPFLGLARVFIYGLGDIDRASDAIQQAQKLGYTTGDRETAQLADGYRARGDTLMRTAHELEDMPQESEYLQRAADAYRQARDLYGRIPGAPGVAANLRRTTRALEEIEARVAEREAVPEAPWR